MSPAYINPSHCPCCGQSLPVVGLTADRFTKRAIRGSRSVQLSPSEYTLLARLLVKPGQWVSLDAIIFAMWVNVGAEEPNSAVRVVSAMTYRLRKKLPQLGFTLQAHKSHGRRLIALPVTTPPDRGFSATTNREDVVYTQSRT